MAKSFCLRCGRFRHLDDSGICRGCDMEMRRSGEHDLEYNGGEDEFCGPDCKAMEDYETEL